MAQLVIAAGIGLAGLCAAAAIRRHNAEARERNERYGDGFGRVISPAWGLAGVALGALVAATACFYTQDVGDTVVVRNLGHARGDPAALHRRAQGDRAVRQPGRRARGLDAGGVGRQVGKKKSHPSPPRVWVASTKGGQQ